MYRLQGELLQKKGDRDEAEKYLQRSIEIAREQFAKWHELHAAKSLAELWRKQGKNT